MENIEIDELLANQNSIDGNLRHCLLLGEPSLARRNLALRIAYWLITTLPDRPDRQL